MDNSYPDVLKGIRSTKHVLADLRHVGTRHSGTNVVCSVCDQLVVASRQEKNRPVPSPESHLGRIWFHGSLRGARVHIPRCLHEVLHVPTYLRKRAEHQTKGLMSRCRKITSSGPREPFDGLCIQLFPQFV